MAELKDMSIKVELQAGPTLRAFCQQSSDLIVDRDKYKLLYESSQSALTDVLGELVIARHELDSIKGAAHG